mgnify:CR=1 FL=1
MPLDSEDDKASLLALNGHRELLHNSALFFAHVRVCPPKSSLRCRYSRVDAASGADRSQAYNLLAPRSLRSRMVHVTICNLLLA